MSVFVKICGLRDAETVAAVVAAGAHAVGFVFAESPRRVTVEEAVAATRELPQGVRRVAVMRHPSEQEWAAVRDGFAPDVLQTDIADFDHLDVPETISRWPVIREGDVITGWPAEFVYEGRQSGVGQTVDWQSAREVATRGRMVLAGGLDLNNVAMAINVVRPFGVDVSSGVESAPGIKDPALIRAFTSAVRTAEKEG